MRREGTGAGWLLAGFLLSAAWAGCGDDGTPPPPDAGDRDGGGPEVDGSVPDDGSTPVDTGAPPGDGGGGVPIVCTPESPADGASDVPSGTVALRWSCAPAAARYDVRFGTGMEPPVVATDLGMTRHEVTASPGTTHTWQVVAYRADGTADPGPVWSFSTCGAFVACADAPTVTDDDGNTYPTVQICGQCWMAQNLNVGTQRTVDPGASPSSNFQTDDGRIEKYCPENRASGCTSYGGLYQHGELMAYGAGPRGICPAGWHVPSDEEWKTLERALGMSASEADRRNDDGVRRGTDQGTQLMAGGAANFDAPLAGFASEIFGHYDISRPGSIGRYWTGTPSGPNAWFRGLSSADTGVDRSIESGEHGYSARCVRD